MKRTVLFFCAALFAFSLNASAQVRPIEKNETKDAAATMARTPAPASFEAKYEGGMFGFNDKQKGTLKFDDVNERLVFYGENQKELFAIPYGSMLVVSPQSKSVRSTAGTVVSVIPLPGARLAGLLREKRRYLLVSFNDPDSDVRGLANFKLDNKQMLESVVRTLGGKAKLTQRGDAYYRPRSASRTEL